MAFGGSSISKELYDFIRAVLEPGKTILEFGSGEGSTGELSKHYKMYSIEHDARFVGKYDSTYIHAPLVQGWYDVAAIQKGLPEKYDLILLDGPVGEGNRIPIMNYLSLFSLKGKWIVVDDTHRVGEIVLFHALLERLPNEGVVVGEDYSAIKVKA